MLYETCETITHVYGWNTGQRFELEKGAVLSDYTELQEEFEEKTLQETWEWVKERNSKCSFASPKLMMITTGHYKSCRVWADIELLHALPNIRDPKQGFEYYAEEE